MALIDINLEEEKGQDFEVHQPGMAELRIDELDIRANNKQDGFYVNLRLKVLETENPSAIWHTCSLKPKAIWNLGNLIEACGKGRPKLSGIPQDPKDEDDVAAANILEGELRELLVGECFMDEVKIDRYTKSDGSVKTKNVLAGNYKRA